MLLSVGSIAFYRRIVGGKPCLVPDNISRVIAQNCDTANVHNTRFAHPVERFEGQTVALGDMGFHSAKDDNFTLRGLVRENKKRDVAWMCDEAHTQTTHSKAVEFAEWVQYNFHSPEWPATHSPRLTTKLPAHLVNQPFCPIFQVVIDVCAAAWAFEVSEADPYAAFRAGEWGSQRIHYRLYLFFSSHLLHLPC